MDGIAPLVQSALVQQVAAKLDEGPIRPRTAAVLVPICGVQPSTM
jgi:hypothetical protein